MANFAKVSEYFYIGAAADVKPVASALAAKCYEHDTKKWFITPDGTGTWTEMQDLDALVLGDGSAVIGKVDNNSLALTPAIYNVTMTNADTEYSQALPANCKKFNIKTLDGSAFRLAYVTGKVATPTAPYQSIDLGGSKSEDGLNLASQTLYFACSSAGKIAVIEAWS